MKMVDQRSAHLTVAWSGTPQKTRRPSREVVTDVSDRRRSHSGHSRKKRLRQLRDMNSLSGDQARPTAMRPKQTFTPVLLTAGIRSQAAVPEVASPPGTTPTALTSVCGAALSVSPAPSASLAGGELSARIWTLVRLRMREPQSPERGAEACAGVMSRRYPARPNMTFIRNNRHVATSLTSLMLSPAAVRNTGASA